MDLEVIERLMQMLAKSDVEELDVTEGNLRIRLAKGSAVRAAAAATPTAPSSGPTHVSVAEPSKGSDLHPILAGLPGIFYRSPAPGAAPFVKEGDAIVDGQQLGIIEAMKMMNPVEADCDGVVEAVLLEDAAAAQAGTPLFRIRKADK